GREERRGQPPAHRPGTAEDGRPEPRGAEAGRPGARRRQGRAEGRPGVGRDQGRRRGHRPEDPGRVPEGPRGRAEDSAGAAPTGDLPYSAQVSPLKLVGQHTGPGTLAATADGMVHFWPAGVMESVWRAAITANGGEKVNLP